MWFPLNPYVVVELEQPAETYMQRVQGVDTVPYCVFISTQLLESFVKVYNLLQGNCGEGENTKHRQHESMPLIHP